MEKKDRKRESDTFLLTLGDFARQCYKSRRKISIMAGSLALFAFVYFLTSPILYTIEGTFLDKGKSTSVMSQSFSELILMGSGKVESEAVTFMKSRKLLENVIQAVGGQASISSNAFQFPLIAKIRDNLLLEYASWSGRISPVLSDPAPLLEVSNVAYSGSAPYSTKVRFTSPTQFTLSDPSLKEPLKGEAGVPVVHPAFSLTIYNMAPNDISGREFDLSLAPMDAVILRLKNMYNVEADKFDKNLIRIKYCDPQRARGCEYVNTLMLAYQDYLDQEHHRIADKQLQYLEKRQNEIVANLRKVMEDYAENQSEEQQTVLGFSALQKESENLAKLQMETEKRLMDINLESSRLKSILCGNKCVFYDHFTERGDPGVINHILNQIREYERQSDTLIASLDFNKVAIGKEPNTANQEFAGMDLETSKQLHVNYSRDLSEVQASIKQHDHIIQQIQDTNFEVCSIGTLLQDPISAERMAKASNLLLALKDENNRTLKEQSRIRQDLDLEKSFLTLHLKQMVQLLALKESVLTEKIVALQNATYNLTQQQINILRKNLTDYLSSRMESLKEERALLSNYLKDLNAKISAAREKLISELLVDQHIELTQQMVEELTKLVESKNISSNLELIQSAPVDHAVPPIHPKFPHLILKTVLAAFVGALLGICWIFGLIVRHGIPATPSNLKSGDELVAGTISGSLPSNPQKSLRDADLDALRRAVQLLETGKHQSVLLLPGKGTDLTLQLARLLKEKGAKTIVLPLQFGSTPSQEELPGLLQYIQGQAGAPKIVKGAEWDRISSGGFNRYSTELLQQNSFKTLLDKLRSDYNWIIGVCQAPLDSAEAQTLVSLFDRTLISVTDETIEQLEPYLQQEPRRAVFLFVENS